MVKGVRSLAIGLTLAALCAGVGYWIQDKEDRAVAAAQAKCEQSVFTEKSAEMLGIMTCNQFDYFRTRTVDGKKVALFDELDAALHKQDERVPFRWYFAAAVLAVLGALPYLWYFLLRRVGEVREAVTGKKSEPPPGVALATPQAKQFANALAEMVNMQLMMAERQDPRQWTARTRMLVLGYIAVSADLRAQDSGGAETQLLVMLTCEKVLGKTFDGAALFAEYERLQTSRPDDYMAGIKVGVEDMHKRQQKLAGVGLMSAVMATT